MGKKDLSPQQQERLRRAEDPEEILAIGLEEGCALTDDELDAVGALLDRLLRFRNATALKPEDHVGQLGNVGKCNPMRGYRPDLAHVDESDSMRDPRPAQVPSCRRDPVRDSQPALALADERVSWKVPTLFNNDWVALTLAKELAPFLPKPLFSSAYGCTDCAWAGGRNTRMPQLSEEELRRYFEAYAQVGATCALTFSRPDAGDYLNDAYCNMLLSLVGEFGGSAIVVDERLARHIRSTHPEVSLAASYNLCLLARAKSFHGIGEEKYYRKLLELYDVVIVRNEALLEGGIAWQLVDVADRIELIVNQNCLVDCPFAAEHVAATAKAIEAMREGRPAPSNGCIIMRRGLARQPSTYVDPARRRVLADMGFTRFKIAGRNTSASMLVGNILGQILSGATSLASTESMRRIVRTVALLDQIDSPPQLLACIPRM